MGNRFGQFDMPHTLPANASQSYLDTATIADHSAMFDAFIFSARAFPIFYRTENAFTEQATFLRFESTIINRLRILDFPFGPRPDGSGDAR
jgi:hypothetical protein